jgi:lysozyme
MNISENGIALIKDSEGYSEKAYRCPAGFWTIGYGSTQTPDGRYIIEGQTCTKEQALEYLHHDICAIVGYLNANLPQLNQNQFDALVSLIYNIGLHSFKQSSLSNSIRLNVSPKYIKKNWLVWDKAKDPKIGKLISLAGLKCRRINEVNLYFSKS